MPATTSKPISERWPTLLGAGNAFVVHLPIGFSLKQSLEQATEIRLATAFAHYAGWYHMKTVIEHGSASVRLLTGTEFFQTEPGLLKSWLSLAQSSGNRVDSRLAANDPFFHPKALIVNGSAGCAFAIVGSGNLSQGGLHNNVECSIYMEDYSTIRQLIEWFDKQFDAGVKLNRDVIENYQRMYKQNHKRRTELQENQQRAVKELEAIGRAEMGKWNNAVNAAVQYFREPRFKSEYAARQAAAPRILKALDSPDFNFRRSGFDTFYKIGELGQLDYRWKDRVFRKARRLKQGLRRLIASPESTLPDVLEKKGNHYVPGVRLNFISKVLAAYAPQTWPVFNNKIAKALRSFQYQAAHRTGVAAKYLAYRDLMKEFAEACKTQGYSSIDALALDAFFYHWAQQLEEPKKRKSQ